MYFPSFVTGSLSAKKTLWISFFIVCVTTGILFALGRDFICQCGEVWFWSGDISSATNSQMIADPYTFTHVTHGLLLYLILWFVAPNMPVAWRFVLALGLESLWEIIENTDAVINYYRSVTISLGYYGDSIVNSVADIFAMMAGFWVAWRWPVWASVVLVLFMELLLAFTIRDSLLLNILMFIYPHPGVLEWQQGL